MAERREAEGRLTVRPSKLRDSVYEALVKLGGPAEARLGIRGAERHHVASIHGTAVGRLQFIRHEDGARLGPLLERPWTHVLLHLKHGEEARLSSTSKHTHARAHDVRR